MDKDNRNGIMRAAVSGDTTSLAVALADPRQNIDHMDSTKFGYNALMLAAQHDHQDVARMLLDAGADTGLLTSTDVEEENSWSNVMVAAWYGDQEVRAPSSSCRLRLTLSVCTTAPTVDDGKRGMRRRLCVRPPPR